MGKSPFYSFTFQPDPGEVYNNPIIRIIIADLAGDGNRYLKKINFFQRNEALFPVHRTGKSRHRGQS
jgi:hypothetical protein